MKNDIVGKEAFANASARRFTVAEIDGIGAIRLRSLLTSEYVKIEGLATRAIQSLAQGKKADAHKFLLEGKVALITACVVDDQGNPIFGRGDSETIKGWDYGLLSAIEEACTGHCGIDGFDLEEAGKNSGPMPGSGSASD